MPAVIFFARLDLDQIILFLDGHGQKQDLIEEVLIGDQLHAG